MMMRRQRSTPFRWVFYACAATLVLAGCAGHATSAGTTQALQELERPASSAPRPLPSADSGVRHVVQAGQTLWRIAKVYGVSLVELQQANAIDDASRVEIGAALWIPGAARHLEVPPYPAPLPGVPGTATTTSYSTGPSRSGSFLWPVDGGTVMSYFGAPRSRGHKHGGVDIRGNHGQKVRAAAAGTVTYSGSTMRRYGRTVIVDHGNGTSTLYAHNSALLVRVGQKVRAGETIARVGRTGNATTDHVHFEIRRGNVTVDPLPYLDGRRR
jgi:lipoprotein NlpD